MDGFLKKALQDNTNLPIFNDLKPHFMGYFGLRGAPAVLLAMTIISIRNQRIKKFLIPNSYYWIPAFAGMTIRLISVLESNKPANIPGQQRQR